jgi:UDP-glucose 4-epimerase
MAYMNSKTETLIEQEKLTVSERQKTALVTGGAGFIGSHLADRLIAENYRVIIVDNLSTGKKENINPKAVFYQMDILSPDLSGVFAKENPEIVFHLAAQISVRQSTENPVKDAETNILGSLNLLQNFIKTLPLPSSPSLGEGEDLGGGGIKSKVIFASTGGALYGDAEQIPTSEDYPIWPLSPYGIAKSTVEKYLYYYHQIFNLPFISLRLANVYGPRQDPQGEAGVVAIFCNKLLNNEQPVINGTGEQTRDYVFVGDVAEALLLAANTPKTGMFNVGTGKETSVNQLFEMLKNIIRAKQQAVYGSAKTGEQQRSALDYSKIKNELAWEPAISLEQGLEKTVNWFANNK